MLEDLNPQEFQDNLTKDGNTLIDVREKWELDICKIEGAVNMPMSSIMETFSELNPESSYSIYCHHGMRSMQVANFLLSNGCLLYTSPSPRDKRQSRMPSSA